MPLPEGDTSSDVVSRHQRLNKNGRHESVKLASDTKELVYYSKLLNAEVIFYETSLQDTLKSTRELDMPLFT